MRSMLIAGLMAASLVGGVPASAQPIEATRREIVKVEDDWRKARIASGALLRRRRPLPGDGRQGAVARRGHRAGRDRRSRPKFIEHGPLDIATYGDTAVVTGVDHLGSTAFGRYGEMVLRFTEVLVKREGRWQLVIQQATATSGF